MNKPKPTLLNIVAKKSMLSRILPKSIKLFFWTHLVLPIYQDYIEETAEEYAYDMKTSEHEDYRNDLD